MKLQLHSAVQVRIDTETGRLYGPGTQELLEGIRRCGSVHQACEDMEMSYSKGRKILRNLEQRLGVTIVSRTRGGSGGGSARLTETGEYLLERFAAYERSVRYYAEQQFEVCFADLAEQIEKEKTI